MSQNIFKPIFDKIGAMSLHEKRIRYCQLAPGGIAGTLTVIENIEYVTLMESLRLENELSAEPEKI